MNGISGQLFKLLTQPRRKDHNYRLMAISKQHFLDLFSNTSEQMGIRDHCKLIYSFTLLLQKIKCHVVDSINIRMENSCTKTFQELKMKPLHKYILKTLLLLVNVWTRSGLCGQDVALFFVFLCVYFFCWYLL